MQESESVVVVKENSPRPTEVLTSEKGNVPVFGGRRKSKTEQRILYRKSKRKEVAEKKASGTDEKPNPYLRNVRHFQEYPILDLHELESLKRHECVEIDECNSEMYWAEIGMASDGFLDFIPAIRRTHVTGLSLGEPDAEGNYRRDLSDPHFDPDFLDNN
jgi:hypothetical protein